MLTGFSLSSSLIGVSGHWDGCIVEEKDEAATRPMHSVRKQTSPVAFVKLVAAIRRKSPGSDSFIANRKAGSSHPVVFIRARWPSGLSAAFGVGMAGAVAGVEPKGTTRDPGAWRCRLVETAAIAQALMLRFDDPRRPDPINCWIQLQPLPSPFFLSSVPGTPSSHALRPTYETLILKKKSQVAIVTNSTREWFKA